MARNPSLRAVRKSELEQPREVRVQYPSLDARYMIGQQYERVLGGRYVDEQEIVSTVVMTDNEARQFVARQLYSQHAARWQVQWVTSHAFAWLEPTDVVTLPRGAVTYTVRIVDKRYSGNVIEWSGETDDPSVYSQSGVGAAVAASISGVQGTAATQLYLLDIPLLRAEDDGTGLYVTGAGVLDTWQGAELYRSTDSGVNYVAAGVQLLPGAAVGNATTALAMYNGGNTFDTLNAVTVSVVPGSATLASASRTAVLNGANHAVLGNEIIAFATATLVSAGVYTLRDLLRGRVGTEAYMATHLAGDRFALLAPNVVRRETVSTNDIGNVLYYKAASFRRTVAETGAVTLTYSDNGQKCLSPVWLRGERNASTNDVTISWTRRSRIPSGWVDYNDIPLGEASELYDLEIWDSAYTTLKRTFSNLTTSSQLYTATGTISQTTDFGSPQATLYCRVYQKNTTVGRGFVLQGSIT